MLCICSFWNLSLAVSFLLRARSLRLLATLDARAFIMLTLAELGKRTRLGTRTLKTAQCAVNRLIFLDADLRHSFPSLRAIPYGGTLCTVFQYHGTKNRKNIISVFTVRVNNKVQPAAGSGQKVCLPGCCRGLLDDQIDDLARHDDLLDHLLALDRVLHLFLSQRGVDGDLLVAVRRQLDRALELAVDLHGDLDRILDRLGLVVNRPRRDREQALAAHLLPQFLTGLILLFPHAILHEASVTFLGFGLSPEQPAIGVILSESMSYLTTGKWWLALFPGLALVGTVALFALLGDRLRRILDPATIHQ